MLRRFLDGTAFLREGEGGGGGGGGGDPKPWHDGKATPEEVGHWQNKGWDIKDPAAVALAASKAHREAEKFLGAPADSLIRIPKEASDEAGWKAVWSRLGTPADAKDYDLTSLKPGADGKVDEKLAEALRTGFVAAKLPKDAGVAVTAAVQKWIEDSATAAAAAAGDRSNVEKLALKTNWGANEAVNLAVAKEGAAALGFTAEEVTALERVAGYAKTMEALRKVGLAAKEIASPPGGPGGGGNIMTLDQARARRVELMTDKAWTKKFTEGDAEAKRTMAGLDTIIANAMPSISR